LRERWIRKRRWGVHEVFTETFAIIESIGVDGRAVDG